MTIYIDSEYRCHLENADGRTAIETDVFDEKCKGYIEGYKYIPISDDGGYIMTPAVPYNTIKVCQTQYKEDLEILNIITEGVIDDDEPSTGNPVQEED